MQQVDVLNFFAHTEPAIVVEGGNNLTFPPNNASGTFIVRIYTTSAVKSLDVVNNKENTKATTVIFHSYPKFEVVATFEVTVDLPDGEKREGEQYTIHVENEEKKVATQEITIVKAERKL